MATSLCWEQPVNYPSSQDAQSWQEHQIGQAQVTSHVPAARGGELGLLHLGSFWTEVSLCLHLQDLCNGASSLYEAGVPTLCGQDTANVHYTTLRWCGED